MVGKQPLPKSCDDKLQYDCAGVCVCTFKLIMDIIFKKALEVAVETKSASYHVYGCVRSFSEP